MLDNKRFYGLMTIRKQMLQIKSLPVRLTFYFEKQFKTFDNFQYKNILLS